MATSRIVTEYGICSANTADELAGYVNEQIRNGFVLHDALFLSGPTDDQKFHQAMVKYGVIKKAPRKKAIAKK